MGTANHGKKKTKTKTNKQTNKTKTKTKKLVALVFVVGKNSI